MNEQLSSEEDLPDSSRSVLVLTDYDSWVVASYLRPRRNGAPGWRFDHEDQNTTTKIVHWEELPVWPR
jgi:hypothetical protein